MGYELVMIFDSSRLQDGAPAVQGHDPHRLRPTAGGQEMCLVLRRERRPLHHGGQAGYWRIREGGHGG